MGNRRIDRRAARAMASSARDDDDSAASHARRNRSKWEFTGKDKDDGSDDKDADKDKDVFGKDSVWVVFVAVNVGCATRAFRQATCNQCTRIRISPRSRALMERRNGATNDFNGDLSDNGSDPDAAAEEVVSE
jgi:hypothetical protein